MDINNSIILVLIAIICLHGCSTGTENNDPAEVEKITYQFTLPATGIDLEITDPYSGINFTLYFEETDLSGDTNLEISFYKEILDVPVCSTCYSFEPYSIIQLGPENLELLSSIEFNATSENQIAIPTGFTRVFNGENDGSLTMLPICGDEYSTSGDMYFDFSDFEDPKEEYTKPSGFYLLMATSGCGTI